MKYVKLSTNPYLFSEEYKTLRNTLSSDISLSYFGLIHSLIISEEILYISIIEFSFQVSKSLTMCNTNIQI